jgi:hypothetical protein
MSGEEGRAFALECAHRLDAEIEEMSTGEVHPSTRENVHWWLAEMRDAACRGDVAEAHRLAGRCKRCIRRDVEWHRENMAKIATMAAGSKEGRF